MCQGCVRKMKEANKTQIVEFLITCSPCWQQLWAQQRTFCRSPGREKEALRFYFKSLADIWHLTSLACVDLVFVLLWVLTSASIRIYSISSLMMIWKVSRINLTSRIHCVRQCDASADYILLHTPRELMISSKDRDNIETKRKIISNEIMMI